MSTLGGSMPLLHFGLTLEVLGYRADFFIVSAVHLLWCKVSHCVVGLRRFCTGQLDGFPWSCNGWAPIEKQHHSIVHSTIVHHNSNSLSAVKVFALWQLIYSLYLVLNVFSLGFAFLFFLLAAWSPGSFRTHPNVPCWLDNYKNYIEIFTVKIILSYISNYTGNYS